MRLVLDRPTVFIASRGEDRSPWAAPRTARSLHAAKASRLIRALVDGEGRGRWACASSRSWPAPTRATCRGCSTSFTARSCSNACRAGRSSPCTPRALIRRWAEDYRFGDAHRFVRSPRARGAGRAGGAARRRGSARADGARRCGGAAGHRAAGDGRRLRRQSRAGRSGDRRRAGGQPARTWCSSIRSTRFVFDGTWEARACATRRARKSSPTCSAARRPRRRRRPLAGGMLGARRRPQRASISGVSVSSLRSLRRCACARPGAGEVAVQQLAELLHLRRAQLLARRLRLSARLRLSGLPDLRLHLDGGRLVPAIGLGRLLGLGLDLLLHLLLALRRSPWARSRPDSRTWPSCRRSRCRRRPCSSRICSSLRRRRVPLPTSTRQRQHQKRCEKIVRSLYPLPHPSMRRLRELASSDQAARAKLCRQGLPDRAGEPRICEAGPCDAGRDVERRGQRAARHR